MDPVAGRDVGGEFIVAAAEVLHEGVTGDAVWTQWDNEARMRRLNDPYPLSVSWAAADASLTDTWDSLVKLAGSGAGWPTAAPEVDWAAGPGDLAGKGRKLADVLVRVPTGRLVVLGEPGSGKTMLMVRLVLDLLARRANGLVKGLLLGLGFGLVPGLVLLLALSIGGWLVSGIAGLITGLFASGVKALMADRAMLDPILPTAVAAGLSGAIAAGVMGALMLGLKSGLKAVPEDLTTAESPKMVLARDRRAALLLIFVAGVVGGGVAALAGALGFGLAGALGFGLAGALGVGFFVSGTRILSAISSGYLATLVAGAWVAQLMEALVAERRPDRPVPPMAGTAAIAAVVHLLATAIGGGPGPVLDERHPGRHRLPSAAGLTAGPAGG